MISPINYSKLIKALSITLILTPHPIKAEPNKKESTTNKSLTEYSKETFHERKDIEKERNEKKIMDLVRKSLPGMVEPVEVFDGPGKIKGVVVKNKKRDNNQLPVWVVDNKYVLLGDISDEKGEMISRFSYLNHILTKKITKEALAQVQGVQLTKGKRKLIVFADPNCPFCNKLYKDIKKIGFQEFEKSNLQLEWIPVAILNPGEANKKGIAILKGGIEAIEKNEQKYNYSASTGGIKGEELELNIDLASVIVKNTDILRKFDEGRGAMTPTIVWTDKKGKRKVHIGVPKTLGLFFE